MSHIRLIHATLSSFQASQYHLHDLYLAQNPTFKTNVTPKNLLFTPTKIMQVDHTCSTFTCKCILSVVPCLSLSFPLLINVLQELKPVSLSALWNIYTSLFFSHSKPHNPGHWYLFIYFFTLIERKSVFLFILFYAFPLLAFEGNMWKLHQLSLKGVEV